ncbi:hypothetical protein D3Z58_16770 [Clostridiaceae bacterium]|nr:hypothetical protein [Clostridiaceae bacterium]
MIHGWLSLFATTEQQVLAKKIPIPLRHYSEQKNVLLYYLKIYSSTQFCSVLRDIVKTYLQTVKKKACPTLPDIVVIHLYMKNVRKHDKHLDVLFFADIFRQYDRCRSPPFHPYQNG